MPDRRNPSDLIFAGIVGALAAVLIMFGLTWLTGDDDEGTTTTAAASTTQPTTTSTTTGATSTSTTEATTTSTTEAPPATSAPGDTATKTAPGEPFGVSAFLTDVRVGSHDGFTRVVFDFEGAAVPWWRVGYEEGPFLATTGEAVDVEGGAFLQVLMSATGVDLTGEEIRLTYRGPERIDGDGVKVVEIVQIEDFEGVSVWVIGVSGERAFTVGTLTDPARVYVDIAD